MIKRTPSPQELSELRRIADIQFRGVGNELIPSDILLVLSPATGKIRYLEWKNKLYLSIRASDYRFLLHVPSGLVLNTILPHPHLRVYVDPKYSRFIAEGGNVFCKHVAYADPEIRPGDEVLVVDASSHELLGVGRAVKPGWEITYYRWGEAIRIREGVLED